MRHRVNLEIETVLVTRCKSNISAPPAKCRGCLFLLLQLCGQLCGRASRLKTKSRPGLFNFGNDSFFDVPMAVLSQQISCPGQNLLQPEWSHGKPRRRNTERNGALNLVHATSPTTGDCSRPSISLRLWTMISLRWPSLVVCSLPSFTRRCSVQTEYPLIWDAVVKETVSCVLCRGIGVSGIGL